MGCDIHLYVEVRGPDGRWQIRDDRGPAPNDEVHTYEDWKRWYDVCPPYIWQGRHYGLFAILAGVRNYSGYVPVNQPRGVPAGASETYLQHVDRYGQDGHSHSWQTVAELLAYDWSHTTRKSGHINLLGYAELRQRGYPSWLGQKGSWAPDDHGCSPRDLARMGRKISPELDLRLLATAIELQDAETIQTARAEWHEPYSQVVGSFYDKTLPALQQLGPPDDVRIVYFFDN